MEIMDASQRDAEEKVWMDAAKHFLGVGLQMGTPSLDPARRARSWLVRNKRLDEARALDNIVCGAVWPGGREGIIRKCRCGANETPWHKYWGCPMLHKCEAAAVRNTQYLDTVFPKPDNMALECLWARQSYHGVGTRAV